MVFPGGNTCLGFYSFYDNIAPHAQRIFILKGGPGAGKSTFMQQIGEEIQARGFDIELHWCSSTNESLDAVAVPALGVAVLDGTAPHVVDPHYPGVVDEIVNLGDFWDPGKLAPYRSEIIEVGKRVSRHFAAAYSSLGMARMAREEEKSYRRLGFNNKRFHETMGEIFRRVFGERISWGDGEPGERHLFASALTPRGVVHFMPTLLDGIESLYLLRGESGTGKEYILSELAGYAYRSGLMAEVYHCAFDPVNTDLVVIPKLKTAALNLFPELAFETASLPELKSCAEYDCNSFSDAGAAVSCSREINEVREIFSRCFRRGLDHIRKAKEAHDEIERYYIEAMDFAGVEQLRRKIRDRILAYAGGEQG